MYIDDIRSANAAPSATAGVAGLEVVDERDLLAVEGKDRALVGLSAVVVEAADGQIIEPVVVHVTGGGGVGMGGPGGGVSLEDLLGGAGPGGNCVCLKCGHKAPHKRGTPCAETKCPKCGASMTRG